MHASGGIRSRFAWSTWGKIKVVGWVVSTGNIGNTLGQMVQVVISQLPRRMGVGMPAVRTRHHHLRNGVKSLAAFLGRGK